MEVTEVYCGDVGAAQRLATVCNGGLAVLCTTTPPTSFGKYHGLDPRAETSASADRLPTEAGERRRTDGIVVGANPKAIGETGKTADVPHAVASG